MKNVTVSLLLLAVIFSSCGKKAKKPFVRSESCSQARLDAVKACKDRHIAAGDKTHYADQCYTEGQEAELNCSKKAGYKKGD